MFVMAAFQTVKTCFLLFHRQNDLVDVFAAIEHILRLFGVGDGQHRIDRRADPPAATFGHTSRTSAAKICAFICGGRERRVLPMMRTLRT